MITQKKQVTREALKSPFFYSYLITDPKEYGQSVLELEQNLFPIFQKFSIDIVCFRDKQSKDILPLAKKTLEIARECKIPKVLLNTHVDLAKQLGFDGVHLPSTEFEKIEQAKDLGLYIFASTHTHHEIEFVKNKGIQGVTYSPIFHKEGKGEPKGCEDLQNVVAKYQEKDFDIFALGGIDDPAKLRSVQKTGAKGFASISYFTKNDLS